MAQKPSKDPTAKPPEADSTVRLPRKNLGLEKDEPTLALQLGTPVGGSTLRLKRDELSLEEPTVALRAGVPAAAATLRMKRDEMSLEEPTEALQRPGLRTAMEVIEEATQIVTAPAKPSVMMPDSSDIPSWEDITEHFIHPGPEPMEDTLIFPDVSELDDLPGAMKVTQLMPTVEPPPVMPMMKALEASMEATTILQVAPPANEPSAPMEKTMVVPMIEAPATMEATLILHAEPVTPKPSEPMEATIILQVKPQASEPSAPMEKTMVMPLVEVPAPMEATIIVQRPAEDPSPFLTRHGQSPLPLPKEPSEPPPGATHVMSGSLESMVKDATAMIPASDSGLAPVAPEAPAMDGGSPLAKVTEAIEVPAATRPVLTPYVDHSAGMAMTPRTLLMPTQQKDSQPMVKAVSQPMPPVGSQETKGVKTATVDVLPSVPGYPDRSVPVPVLEPKVHLKPLIPPLATYQPIPVEPVAKGSKLWIPIVILTAIIAAGGIYATFLSTSAKSKALMPKAGPTPSEPSLPVPPSLQPTLDLARAGDAKAMHLLGVSFFYGQDVPRNRVEGIRWLRKAAAAGSESAKSDLRQMEIEMH